MGFLTTSRDILNWLLRPINARIESLTAERAEINRLQALERRGARFGVSHHSRGHLDPYYFGSVEMEPDWFAESRHRRL
jgi:hypothetical protein